MIKKVFETIVFLHLRRHHSEIFYYKNKQEVDFCFHYKDQVHLINVAWQLDNPSTLNREIEGLALAMHDLGIDRATLITAHENSQIENEGKLIDIIPLWHWLLKSHK